MRQIDVSKLETVIDLFQLDLMVMDCVVEWTPRDTTTRLRYVRASSQLQETSETVATLAASDTASIVTTQTIETPIAAESIKNGVAWLCPLVRMALLVIILVFFVFFLRYVKKYLFLLHD